MPERERKSSHTHFVVLTATILSGAVASLFTYLVSQYGFEGALRLIWEGDHLPTMVRHKLIDLEEIYEKSLHQLSIKIQDLERHEVINKKQVYGISYELDKVATEIDGIQSEGWEVVKIKKKDCSKRIVELMNSVDILLDKID